LKKQVDLFDGVLCYNDSVAIGLLRALVEGGKKIPKDIAIVGFDDAGIGAYLETALSTVAQPALDIGRQAAKLLLNRIQQKGNNWEPQNIFLKTKLIEPILF